MANNVDDMFQLIRSMSQTYGVNVMTVMVMEENGQDPTLLKQNNESMLKVIRSQVQLMIQMRRQAAEEAKNV